MTLTATETVSETDHSTKMQAEHTSRAKRRVIGVAGNAFICWYVLVALSPRAAGAAALSGSRLVPSVVVIAVVTVGGDSGDGGWSRCGW